MPAFGRWSTVRAFGKVKYFNISYGVLFGVPMALPLMHWLGAAAPFSTTLRWVYGASFAFAIAIAFYQWRCPEVIKRFGRNVDEYLEAEYESYRRALPSHRLNVVLANLDPEFDHADYEKINTLLRQRDAAIGNDRAATQKQLDEVIDRLHPNAVQRYLLKNYECLDESDPIFRLVSFALYLIGTGILLALLLWRSYGVLLTS